MSSENNQAPLVLPPGLDCHTLARLLINVIERRALQVCESDRRCLQRASLILSGNDCRRTNITQPQNIQVKKEPEDNNLSSIKQENRVKVEPREDLENQISGQGHLEPKNLFRCLQNEITNGRTVNSVMEQQQPEEADCNDVSESSSQKKNFHGAKLLLQGEKPRNIPIESLCSTLSDPRIRNAEPNFNSVKIKSEPQDDFPTKYSLQRVKTERESNRDCVDMDISSTPDSPQSPPSRQNSSNSLWPVSPKFSNPCNPANPINNPNLPWKFNLIPKTEY